MNANEFKLRHWVRIARITSPISILILSSLYVSTLTAQKPWNDAPRRVLMDIVFEFPKEDVDTDLDLDMGEPFELQFKYIPPDRLQFEKDGEAVARIIGSRYYLKGGPGRWLQVTKETFNEMNELPPLAKLALEKDVMSPEQASKLANMSEFRKAGITSVSGQRCRLYESKITLDKGLPVVRLIINMWVTTIDKLPIRLRIRGYGSDSTEPVGILTVRLDFKTKFRIPTPKT